MKGCVQCHKASVWPSWPDRVVISCCHCFTTWLKMVQTLSRTWAWLISYLLLGTNDPETYRSFDRHHWFCSQTYHVSGSQLARDSLFLTPCGVHWGKRLDWGQEDPLTWLPMWAGWVQSSAKVLDCSPQFLCTHVSLSTARLDFLAACSLVSEAGTPNAQGQSA